MSHPHFHSCVLLRLKSSDVLAMILQNLTSKTPSTSEKSEARHSAQLSYLVEVDTTCYLIAITV